MTIREAEAYGLVFDDIIPHDDVESESEFDEFHAVTLESTVCQEHFSALSPEVVSTSVYRGDQAHDKCGVKGCFADSYAQIYLR